jgi:hypothetical protein
VLDEPQHVLNCPPDNFADSFTPPQILDLDDLGAIPYPTRDHVQPSLKEFSTTAVGETAVGENAGEDCGAIHVNLTDIQESVPSDSDRLINNQVSNALFENGRPATDSGETDGAPSTCNESDKRRNYRYDPEKLNSEIEEHSEKYPKASAREVAKALGVRSPSTFLDLRAWKTHVARKQSLKNKGRIRTIPVTDQILDAHACKTHGSAESDDIRTVEAAYLASLSIEDRCSYRDMSITKKRIMLKLWADQVSDAASDL